MGSRLALPLLLVAALLASGAFLWLSRTTTPERSLAQAPAAPSEARTPGAEASLAEPVDTPQPSAASAEERRAAAEPTLAAPTAVPTPAPEVDGAPRIRGRVVDEQGVPVVDALVLAARDVNLSLDLDDDQRPFGERFETRTDERGRFELSGPPPGTFAFGVRASGFAPFDRYDEALPNDPSYDLGTVTLSAGAILSGRVLDRSGRAVAGAELLGLQTRETEFVILGRQGVPLGVTAEDGSFRLDQLATGPWKLRVHSADHPDGTFEGVATTPGLEVAGLEFVLENGFTIAGHVAGVPESERGRLVVRARRAESDWSDGLVSRTADVDRQGNFTVRGLEEGASYDLQARVRAERSGVFGFMGRSRSGDVRARAGDRGVQLAYQAEAALTFQVLDARSRTPIEDVEVSAGVDWPMPLLSDDGRRLDHHPEGRVRVGNLRPSSPDDRVTLQLAAVGYAPYERSDLAVATGQELELGAIYLEPVPLLVVSVVDAASGEPVSGATVTLEKQPDPGTGSFMRRIEVDADAEGVSISTADGQAVTDAEGIARLTSLEGETCVLRVRSREHAAFELRDLALPVGKDASERVELTQGGEVVVTAFDADGHPLAGVHIEHREPSDGEGLMQSFGQGGPVTDSLGVARFPRLGPGLHRFRIGEDSSGPAFFGNDMVITMGGDDEGGEEWSEVAVTEGGHASLALHAKPRGGLRGTVLEAGAPLADATLVLRERSEASANPMHGLFGGGGGERTRTDDEGRYAFDDVREGEYTLSVEHVQRHMPVDYDVDVHVGSNRFDADLPLSVIEGRLETEDGEPVAGVPVRAERYEERSGPQRRAVAVMISTDGDSTVMTHGGAEVGEGTTSDADGYYRLRGVTPDVELQVVAEGEAVQLERSEPFVVRPDEVVDGVDLTLKPAGRIAVEVIQADGSPASFALVSANYLDEGDVDPERGLAQGGSTTLSGLRPGTWSLSARDVRRGGPGAPGGPGAEVEVVAGETARITLTVD